MYLIKSLHKSIEFVRSAEINPNTYIFLWKTIHFASHTKVDIKVDSASSRK